MEAVIFLCHCRLQSRVNFVSVFSTPGVKNPHFEYATTYIQSEFADLSESNFNVGANLVFARVLTTKIREPPKGTPQDLGRSKSQWVTQFMHGQADGPVPFHYPARGYLDDLISGSVP